jgi:hypothetical protein
LKEAEEDDGREKNEAHVHRIFRAESTVRVTMMTAGTMRMAVMHDD